MTGVAVARKMVEKIVFQAGKAGKG